MNERSDVTASATGKANGDRAARAELRASLLAQECGGGSAGDCAQVIAEVWLFLDNECDAERRALLAKHLDECSPCLAQYGIEEQLKTLLARKCGGEQAPDRLRSKIRRAVLEQADVTVERGPQGTTVEVRTTRIER